MGRIVQRLRSDYRDLLPFDLAKCVFIENDFSDGSSPPGWTVRTSGTGASVGGGNTGVNEHHVGMLGLVMGTTTTGRAALAHHDISELQCIGPGAGPTIVEWDIMTHGNLSDETEAYFYLAGLSDADNASGEGTDALYFKYTHSENSGRWTLHARNASTETVVNTAVTVVASTYYRLTIVRNATNTAAQFLINGVLVGTIATNLPAGSANRTHLCIKAEKTAGTTSRTLYVDYVMFYRGVRR